MVLTFPGTPLRTTLYVKLIKYSSELLRKISEKLVGKSWQDGIKPIFSQPERFKLSVFFREPRLHIFLKIFVSNSKLNSTDIT